MLDVCNYCRHFLRVTTIENQATLEKIPSPPVLKKTQVFWVSDQPYDAVGLAPTRSGGRGVVLHGSAPPAPRAQIGPF